MAVRLNITMDDDIYAKLKKEVPPKKTQRVHLLSCSSKTSSRHKVS